jgi:hypothetical protein
VRRHGPGGEEVDNVVVSITQHRTINVNGALYNLFGGCTLILDLDTLTLRYAIRKPIDDARREKEFQRWAEGESVVPSLTRVREPIAHLHLNA